MKISAATYGLWRVADVEDDSASSVELGKHARTALLTSPAQLPAGQWAGGQHRAVTDEILHMPDGLGAVATGGGRNRVNETDIGTRGFRCRVRLVIMEPVKSFV
jgi:hypothetical protein